MNEPALRQAFTASPDFGYQAEVVPGVHWLRLPLPFRPEDHINVWLIEDDDGPAIVDTGLSDEATRTLWETMLAAYPPVRRVFITHHHPDHIGLAAWFAETRGAEIHVPVLEAELAARLLQPEGGKEMLETYAAHGMPVERAEFAELRHRFYREHVREIPPRIQPVENGARYRLGGFEWIAHLAGGHTPAHMLLHCPERKLLLSGDHILPDIVTNIGALSFDPAATPVADYLATLERCDQIPDDTLVLPAHGLPFYGLQARCKQLREIHRERLDGVFRVCASADTVWTMLPLIYGREMSGLGALLGFNQTKAYLAHLEMQGRVVSGRDATGRVRYRQQAASQNPAGSNA